MEKTEDKKNEGEGKKNQSSLEKQLEKDNKKAEKGDLKFEEEQEEDKEEKPQGDVKEKTEDLKKEKFAAKKEQTTKKGEVLKVDEKKEEEPGMVQLVKELFTELRGMRAELEQIKSGAPVKPAAEEGTDEFVDDFMDEPATFFSFRYKFSVFPDTRRDKLVYPPGTKNHVFFNCLYRYEARKGSRGESEVISICSVVIQSKALYKWMKEHTMFDIMFFETITGAMATDTLRQDKIIAATNQVNGLSEHGIIRKAQEFGIAMSMDIQLMKKTVIQKLADQMVSQEERQNQQRKEALKKRQSVQALGGREVELTQIGEQ